MPELITLQQAVALQMDDAKKEIDALKRENNALRKSCRDMEQHLNDATAYYRRQLQDVKVEPRPMYITRSPDRAGQIMERIELTKQLAVTQAAAEHRRVTDRIAAGLLVIDPPEREEDA